MRLLPSGDRAVLLDFDDAATRLRWDDALRTDPIPGVLDQVPGATTILLTVPQAADLPAVVSALRQRPEPTASSSDGGRPPSVEVAVRYDGADLAEVAGLLGITAQQVVDRHTGQLWTVEFTGFAPGFGYLTGDRGGLAVPRRSHPRARVPAGAVGLAGPYSGVYPQPSPGGWQLIGTTDAPIWDPAADPPALLRPGVRVRFVAVPQ